MIRDDVKEESVKYINQFSKDMLKRIQQAKEVSEKQLMYVAIF